MDATPCKTNSFEQIAQQISLRISSQMDIKAISERTFEESAIDIDKPSSVWMSPKQSLKSDDASEQEPQKKLNNKIVSMAHIDNHAPQLSVSDQRRPSLDELDKSVNEKIQNLEGPYHSDLSDKNELEDGCKSSKDKLN